MVCVEMSLSLRTCVHVCVSVCVSVFVCLRMDGMAWYGDEIRTLTVSQVCSVSKFNVLLISSPEESKEKREREIYQRVANILDISFSHL